MGKSFRYVIKTYNTINKAKEYKKAFNNGNTYVTYPIGNSFYKSPDTNDKLFYLKKDGYEYVYPLIYDHLYRLTLLSVSIFNNMFNKAFEKYNVSFSSMKKETLSADETSLLPHPIPRTFQSDIHYCNENAKTELNPLNLNIIGENCKIETEYKLEQNKSSCVTENLICKLGQIVIECNEKYSFATLNILIKNILCNTCFIDRLYRSSYENVNIKIEKISCEELKIGVNENSNIEINELDCSHSVKIQCDNKIQHLKINKIKGDKNNIILTLDSKVAEDDIEIEGLPYSKWKKTNITSSNRISYPIKGKTFIATGKIIIGPYNTREQIYSLIIAAGGQIAKSKNDYYDYLITDKHFTHGDSTSEKLKDAERRGIIPISSAQLEEMLKSENVL